MRPDTPIDVAYTATLASLYAPKRRGMRLGLATMANLLHRLDNPQAAYPIVLVAGTNGKGSTARYLAGMLQAQDHRVGLYTSPHLLRFSERIRINGEEISTDDIATWLQRCDDVERVAAHRRRALGLEVDPREREPQAIPTSAHRSSKTPPLERIVGRGGPDGQTCRPHQGVQRDVGQQRVFRGA